MRSISVKKKIDSIAKAALDKKGRDVVLIDLRGMSSICDFFVVTSGDSTVQIEAIADNIERELLDLGCRLWHREGKGEALWILLDYGDIVAHVFYKDTRGFYNLEKLWHDAPQKKMTEVPPSERPRRKAKKL